jgi:hypothetical protein
LLTLQDTANFAQPFIQYSPLDAGAGSQPILGIGTIIRNSMMTAPQVWAWNRKEVDGIVVNQGDQDIVVSLTDFGYLEKASLTDAAGNQYELKDIYNNLPLSSDTATVNSGGRPNAIAVIDYVPHQYVIFRLLGIADQAYTLSVVYQKLAEEFSSYSVESVSVPTSYPILVQSKVTNGSRSGGNTYTIAYDNNVTEGNLLIIWAYVYTFDLLGSPTDTMGNEWTKVVNGSTRNESDEIQCWFAIANGTGACTVTWSFFGAGGAFVSSGVSEISGGTLDATPNATRTSFFSSPQQAGSLTTSGDFQLVLQFAGAHGTAAIYSNDGGYTVDSQSSLGAFSSADIATAGSTTPSVASSVGNPGIASAIAIVGGSGGGNPTYNGTFFTGGFPVGSFIFIEGFSNAGNNGTFQVVSSDETTVVVVNANAVNETASATATNPYWDPIPDSYIDVFNNLFLSEALALVDDARSQIYRVRGVSAFLSKATGLTETQKNAFVQQWLARNFETTTVMGDVQLGARGRAI